jgi:hypothetical protein
MEYITLNVIYDKESKIIMGLVEDPQITEHINRDVYDVAEITIKTDQIIVGNSLDDIQILSPGEKTIVREVEVLKNMFDEIDSKYIQYDINKILFKLISENKELIKTEEFLSLVKCYEIAEKKANLKMETAKKFTDRFIFISIDDEKESIEKKIHAINRNAG